jgi:murein L,D-transpeptidase YcbB/YkuD
MFRVWGWDSMRWNGRPAISLRAIVGRRITPTPVLESQISRVIFRPYWNVPPSILRGELLPLIASDPSYVERNNMEVVEPGVGAPRLVPLTPDALEGLRSGRLQLRQRPGPSNALGLVKLQVESDEGVHLHGTPHQQLFEQPSRAFSHGCIRVEDPVALATWMLDDPAAWTRERVIAATSGADAREVRLARPVHVSLFYATAAIDPEDGSLRFADDIYRLDAALERALAGLR